MMVAQKLVPWWRRGAWEANGCPSGIGFLEFLGMEWEWSEQRAKAEVAKEWREKAALVSCWLDGRRLFRRASHCVVSMVQRLMAPIPSEDYYLLLFLCDEEGEGEPYAAEEGVLEVPVRCDVQAILEMDDLSKKRAVTALVEEGARKAAQATGVCLEPIIEACQRVEGLGYANEWIWGEETSPDGSCIAQVCVTQDTAATSVTLEVVSKDGSPIAQREVYRGTPYAPDLWHRVLGDIEWVTDGGVAFVFPDGKKSILAA